MIKTRHGIVRLVRVFEDVVNELGAVEGRIPIGVDAYFYKEQTPQLISAMWKYGESNGIAAADGIGQSTCSETDTFNHKIGNKIAISRALIDAKLTKEQRTEAWEDIKKEIRVE